MLIENEMQKVLSWIDSQAQDMASLVQRWASQNSGSDNAEGLSAMARLLAESFSKLNPEIDQMLPHLCLRFTKRSKAPMRVLLGGHFDTVFSKSHPFQKVSRPEKNILQGPGVADMKGGLVILLKALEAFERSPFCHTMGWEVLLNSDEETGSFYSTPYFETCAKVCDAALLFEPCFPDGALVSARKGSANYSLTSQGKSAHVGRDFSKGKNAILPLANWLSEITKDCSQEEGLVFNVGSIYGGGPVNIVPNFAESQINVRNVSEEQLQNLERKMFQAAERHDIKIKKMTYRPPKPLSSEVKPLLVALEQCGEALGLSIDWRETGGVCDGNTLAALGLPTIDTLGARGDFIHTDQEFIDLSSLTERAKLTALFLMKISTHEVGIK